MFASLSRSRRLGRHARLVGLPPSAVVRTHSVDSISSPLGRRTRFLEPDPALPIVRRCDTRVVKRERAVELAEHVLLALDHGRAEWPLSLVTGLYVFGSFARGAIEPHDVDIDVEFKIDQRWAEHFAGCLAYGRDPHSPMRRALTGGRRGCQFQFNFRDRADFDMTLLWRQDDTLPAALERLHLIRPDPAAGRAERDAMLPQFEGIDRRIPRLMREALSAAVSSGAIAIEHRVLADGPVTSPHAREHLDYRWAPSSPLYRAAGAVITDWEQRGIDPCRGHLHGKDIRDKDTPYFAGLGWRYFRSMPACLTKYGGVEWLEVIHPTRSRSLDALRILPGDRQLLEQTRWA
jgi:hypothetical protein